MLCMYREEWADLKGLCCAPLSRTLSCLTRAEETFKCGYVFVLPWSICVCLCACVSVLGVGGTKFVCKQQSWSPPHSH